jgi:AcrR family transcriptional regulator
MAPATRSARERIVRTAAELFARRGYHAVGMTELQDAVQLKRGALYHHIRSKDDLLYEIARHYIVELLELATEARGEPDLRRRIERLGSDLVEKIASHQAELTVCFREVQSLTDARRDEVLKLHARYERVWRDAFSEGARAGVFRPFDGVVLKGVLGMYFYSYLWMRASGAMGPAEIATRLNDLALRMLAADARPTAARRSTASGKAVATPARRRRASVKVA